MELRDSGLHRAVEYSLLLGQHLPVWHPPWLLPRPLTLIILSALLPLPPPSGRVLIRQE